MSRRKPFYFIEDAAKHRRICKIEAAGIDAALIACSECIPGEKDGEDQRYAHLQVPSGDVSFACPGSLLILTSKRTVGSQGVLKNSNVENNDHRALYSAA